VGQQVEHAIFLTCGTGMALPVPWGIDSCEAVDVKTSAGTAHQLRQLRGSSFDLGRGRKRNLPC